MMMRRAPIPNGHGSDGDYDLFADRLIGAKAIAKFWLGSDDADSVRVIFRLAETNSIPTGRLGGRMVASRRALRRHHEEITSGRMKTRDAAE